MVAKYINFSDIRGSRLVCLDEVQYVGGVLEKQYSHKMTEAKTNSNYNFKILYFQTSDENREIGLYYEEKEDCIKAKRDIERLIKQRADFIDKHMFGL